VWLPAKVGASKTCPLISSIRHNYLNCKGSKDSPNKRHPLPSFTNLHMTFGLIFMVAVSDTIKGIPTEIEVPALRKITLHGVGQVFLVQVPLLRHF
jgi:hypothetical protein